MLRMQSNTGWWLITHPDHARLAGAFATHWGNQRFSPPEPRTSVLHAIHVHDDGWAARDAHASITRQGKPSAFSHELVGKYSSFEEIDLADYLAVRESAVQQVESINPYAALLVSLHTYNLLTDRTDRSTIAPAHLPLLDAFLERQRTRQDHLRAQVRADPQYTPADVTGQRIRENFRLLQACDNLSLLSCVASMQPSTLLHPLGTRDGSEQTIDVLATAPRTFRLSPWPFDEPSLTFALPARHVEGHTFESSADLAQRLAIAPFEELTITLIQ
jgi:hypothetical protein